MNLIKHLGLRSAARPRVARLSRRHFRGESAGRDVEPPIVGEGAVMAKRGSPN